MSGTQSDSVIVNATTVERFALFVLHNSGRLLIIAPLNQSPFLADFLNFDHHRFRFAGALCRRFGLEGCLAGRFGLQGLWAILFPLSRIEPFQRAASAVGLLGFIFLVQLFHFRIRPGARFMAADNFSGNAMPDCVRFA